MKKINFNQIIGSTIEKALSNPNFWGSTFKFLLKHIALSFYVIIICGVLPLLFCGFLLITLLAIINGANLNTLITFTYPTTFEAAKWFISKILFDLFPAALPLMAIWFCCGLFFFLFARNVMRMK